MAQAKLYKDHHYPFKRSPRSVYEGFETLLWEWESEKRAARRLEICEIVDPSDQRSGSGLGDLPWPTMVLGPGCVAIENSNYLDLGLLNQAVIDKLLEIWPPPQPASAGDPDAPVVVPEQIVGISTGDLKTFLAKLYTDRIGSMGAQQPGSSRDEEAGHAFGSGPTSVSTEAVLLLVLSLRFTRLYRLAHAELSWPESRWDDEEVSFDKDFLRSVNLKDYESIETDAKRLLQQLSSAPNDTVDRLVRNLLKRILEGFQRESLVRLRRDDLRLLTEVAWHYLTMNSAVYPGWTELLLSMLFRLAFDGPRSRKRPPIMELKSATDTVADLLEQPTATSWMQRWHSSDRPTAREEFYQAAARLLQEQAKLIVQSRGADFKSYGATYPPAAAFVSGFDIELEMSLWMEEVSFTVMVPVHVLVDEEPTAAFAWLAYDVEPSRERKPETELERLRLSGKWRSGNATLDERERTRPVIVRMSGCPLLRLPNLADPGYSELRDSLGYDEGTNVQIIHAVVVDEYTSMQVSLANIVGTIPEPDRREVVVQSLPRELANDPDRNPRYWMCFGVQVSDSAIRFRLFTQMSNVLLKNRGADMGMFAEAPQQRIPRGLAVNTRIDHDEALLLYWLGLDIVRDDCKNMISALEHCRLHIGNPSKRPDSTNGCILAGEGA